MKSLPSILYNESNFLMEILKSFSAFPPLKFKSNPGDTAKINLILF